MNYNIGIFSDDFSSSYMMQVCKKRCFETTKIMSFDDKKRKERGGRGFGP